jgi:hypothetical protein
MQSSDMYSIMALCLCFYVDYVASNGSKIIHELGRMRKEAVMTYLGYYPSILPEGTDETTVITSQRYWPLRRDSYPEPSDTEALIRMPQC